MKMLSEDHVVVILKINHPFFGALMVDKFQRKRESINSDIKAKQIHWSSFVLPITTSTEILEDPTGMVSPHIYVFVPWNHECGINEGLMELTLEMGRVIRSMDEDGSHSEFWTNDGEYIPDERWQRAFALCHPFEVFEDQNPNDPEIWCKHCNCKRSENEAHRK